MINSEWELSITSYIWQKGLDFEQMIEQKLTIFVNNSPSFTMPTILHLNPTIKHNKPTKLLLTTEEKDQTL